MYESGKGLSSGMLPSKFNRNVLPCSEFIDWESPDEPTSPAVMRRVLSGNTSNRLPL